jgi:enoyl-CoA hydratase
MSAVTTERRDHVLVITINRPEAKNAINAEVARGLAAAAELLDGTDELWVGILTGAGDTFSAGMDLKAFAAGEATAASEVGFGGITADPPGKPLIAAVEGYAVAGGLELALACDLIVAAADATFGIPEVRRGLIAGGGGLLRLPRRVPFHVAMEWALTGGWVPAARAYEVGLVNRLCAPGSALDSALALATEIVANAPMAVRLSKRVLNESLDWPIGEAFDRQAPYVRQIAASADAHEGAVAFAERRDPTWTGV